eukprot:RCo018954
MARRSVPLFVCFVAVMLILSGSCFSSMWALLYSGANNSVSDLARRFNHAVIISERRMVEEILRTMKWVLASWVATRTLPNASVTDVQNYTYRVLSDNSTTMSMYMMRVTMDGEAAGAARFPLDQGSGICYRPPGSLENVTCIPIYADGSRGAAVIAEPVEYRREPWFTAALASKAPVFSSIPEANRSGLKFVALSVPMVVSNSTSGVAAVFVPFSVFSRQLNLSQFLLQSSGMLFLEQGGTVAEYSTSSPGTVAE